MSTFAQIRVLCAKRFSDASNNLVADTTSATQADWKGYVNQVYRRIVADESLFPNRENESTALVSVALTRTIALPTDCTRVLSVHDHTNYVKLEPLEGVAEHLRLWVTQTEDGVPVAYRIRNGNLLLYPLPTGVYSYTVEYLSRPADLSADGDIPAFPSQFHDILVEGALADAYLDDGNLKQYDAHNGRYHDLLQDMRVDLLGERGERYYEPTDNFY